MSDVKASPKQHATTIDPNNGASADAEDKSADTVLEDFEALRVERDKILSLLQRTQADFENYQKRNHREHEQERRYGNRGIVLDLLPVLDNLERAAAAARQAGETGHLVQGVNMVLTQLEDALRKNGVVRIEAEGQPFDPNLHQAVTRQPASFEHAPNTVALVLEPGFMLHDRVLRPAKVMVAVAPEEM